MGIYQHFRQEERPFIDQVLDLKAQVERDYTPIVTDFLDPREQYIFQTIIGNDSSFVLGVEGGYSSAERKRICLAPFYHELTIDDYELTALTAKFPQKFVTLEHRDVLGSIMSLGIHRKKLGDVLVGNGEFHIICDQTLGTFFKLNLTQIKNSSVTLEEIPLAQITSPKENWVQQEGTVSSLRLDVVMKEIYRLSRTKAQQLITKQAVKVNHQVIEEPAYELQSGDLISVRKAGRSQLVSVLGTTRKDKYRIKTARLK